MPATLEETTRRYMLVYYVALASIVWFDWIVTLHKEYRKIWKSKWNAVKIVYLVLRYSMLILTIFILQGFNMDWSTSRCDKYLLGWQNALPLIVQAAIGFMLMLRCYGEAKWGQNKLVLSFLMVLHAAHMGVSCWLSVADVKTLVFPDGNGPCIPYNSRPNLMLGCIMALIYDVAATGLTLYKACQVKAIMGKSMKSTIVMSIIRHGTLYAFGTAIVVCANMALIHESRMRGTPFRGYLGGNLCTVFNTILACRLALSLKKDVDARRAPIAESLTGYNDTFLAMGGTEGSGIPISPRTGKVAFNIKTAGHSNNTGSGYSYNPSSGGTGTTAASGWYSGFKSITSEKSDRTAVNTPPPTSGARIHLPSFPRRTASQNNKQHHNMSSANQYGSVKLDKQDELDTFDDGGMMSKDIELDYMPEVEKVGNEHDGGGEKNMDELRRLSDVISALEENRDREQRANDDLEKGGKKDEALNEKTG